MNYPLNWKELRSIDELSRTIDSSRTKPVLVFKHKPSAQESIEVKDMLENEWNIPAENIDIFLLDIVKYKNLSSEITDIAGVPDEYPQVLLFADGVTMYDESHDMINVKKIKLALKIINRTFKWMETRV